MTGADSDDTRPTLRLGDPDDYLELWRIDGQYLGVAYRSPSLSASDIVYMYTDWPHLIDLFRFMDENWRGWKGAKTFMSVEDDFCLECRHDGRAGAIIRLSLVAAGYRDKLTEAPWQMSTHFEVETAQFERLAREAPKVLGGR